MLLSEKEKVIMTHEELYKQSGQEVKGDFVVGKYGSLRHAGKFTENNPYYIQFQYAQQSDAKNQDLDALYSQAVEWQANYYNTLESREYNDPMNEIQRQRKAGFNPDLAGASGLSSSSGGSSGSQIPAPQSGVEYSNAYGNTESVVSSINAVCNVVNSIATLGTASVNAFEQISTMPSRVSLAETQAYIADETKDVVVSQAKNSDIFQRLSLVKDLAGFFTPESSSEDYTNILTTLGYPSEQIPSYEQAIKNYHSNPVYKSSYEDSVMRANELGAYNSVYTTNVQTELFEKTLAMQNVELNISTLTNKIRTSFLDYLSSNGFGEQVAKNEVANANLTAQDIAFSRTKLERDVTAFAKNLEDIKNEIGRYDARIQAIYGNAKNEHRMISPTEQFEIDTLKNLRMQAMSLGSSQLQQVYGMINNANAIMYQNNVMLNNDGDPIIDPVTPRFMRTIDVTFGEYVKTDQYDIGKLLVDLLPKFSKNPGTTIVNNIKP